MAILKNKLMAGGPIDHVGEAKFVPFEIEGGQDLKVGDLIRIAALPPGGRVVSWNTTSAINLGTTVTVKVGYESDDFAGGTASIKNSAATFASPTQAQLDAATEVDDSEYVVLYVAAVAGGTMATLEGYVEIVKIKNGL